MHEIITVLTFGLNHIVVSNFQSLRDCGRIIKDFNQLISIYKQLIDRLPCICKGYHIQLQTHC